MLNRHVTSNQTGPRLAGMTTAQPLPWAYAAVVAPPTATALEMLTIGDGRAAESWASWQARQAPRRGGQWPKACAWARLDEPEKSSA
jgi:hypothetical protein